MILHPIFNVPSLQCAKCGSMVCFDAIPRGSFLDESVTHADAFCGRCDVTVKVPLTLMRCEVIGPAPNI